MSVLAGAASSSGLPVFGRTTPAEKSKDSVEASQTNDAAESETAVVPPAAKDDALPASSGGLFSSSTPAPSGGLFGNTVTSGSGGSHLRAPTASASGGGLFGDNNSNASSSSGSVIGDSTTTTTSSRGRGLLEDPSSTASTHVFNGQGSSNIASIISPEKQSQSTTPANLAMPSPSAVAPTPASSVAAPVPAPVQAPMVQCGNTLNDSFKNACLQTDINENEALLRRNRVHLKILKIFNS